jgi:hypothetical protein
MSFVRTAAIGALLAATAPCQWTSLQGAWWAMSEHGVAWCPTRNALISFGGMHTATTGNLDTRIYRNGWKVLPTATVPVARRYSPMVTDFARGRIVMHGGNSTSLLGPPIAGDTWEFDGVDWQRIYPPTNPGPVFAHGMAYDAQRQVVVLYGGRRAGFLAYSDETWEYDGTDWTRIVTTNSPEGREGCAMCFDPTSGRVLMFGGRTVSNLLGSTTPLEVWEYDGIDWTQVPSAAPQNRREHAVCYDPVRDVVVMHGGLNNFDTGFNELWVYERATNTWTQVPSLISVGMSGAAMVFDPANQRVVLSGGRSQAQSNQPGPPSYVTRIFGGRSVRTLPGCAGTAGIPRLTTTAQPRVGQPVVWRVDQLAPATSTAVFGFSRNAGLPVQLDPIGMPGCTSMPPPDVLLLATGGGGSAAITWTVPNVTAALGEDVYVQALCLDPGANAGGATVSNAVRTFLGY